MELDDFDRALIQATQSGLPRTPDPYGHLAESLGVDVDHVMNRLRAFVDIGVIRRIGLVPNHYRLGYRANGMSVYDVEDGAMEILGPKIGDLSFVSHCYRRPRCLPDWPYNLFAMVHGRCREEVEASVLQIREILGSDCRRSEILYSTRILKKTGLRLSRSMDQIS